MHAHIVMAQEQKRLYGESAIIVIVSVLLKLGTNDP